MSSEIRLRVAAADPPGDRAMQILQYATAAAAIAAAIALAFVR